MNGLVFFKGKVEETRFIDPFSFVRWCSLARNISMFELLMLPHLLATTPMMMVMMMMLLINPGLRFRWGCEKA